MGSAGTAPTAWPDARTPWGVFRVYHSWLAGLLEMCARWQTAPFTAGGPPTVGSIVPHHRGDRADNAAYIRQVNDRITALLRDDEQALAAA